MDILSIGIADRPPMACACCRKVGRNVYRNRKLYGYAMPIISIANPKGGAGKTTLAFILADQLSSNGASVAVVDADPNAIIAKWHERRTAEGRASPFAVIAKPSEGAMINTVDQLARSEEHTSELQSLMRISYAVFCLKKKNKQKTNSNDNHKQLDTKEQTTSTQKTR